MSEQTKPAHERLAKHIADSDLKDMEFAKRCGFDKWLLSKIKRGHRKPTGPQAAIIERVSGGAIMAAEWFPEHRGAA